ncbi:MAG: hypothetical protein H6Q07_2486 [Acidobacteria bacterium]|nr:hypothetical protein [Acidobacteriota bacterium]
MADTKSKASPEDILVGGQAVIEGVMMRTPHAYAVAVRRADGSIEVKKEPVKRLSDYCKPLSWVVIRGFAVLIQSMVLGLRTLNYSINVSMKDLEAKEKPKKAKKESSAVPLAFSLILGVGVAVVLFILFPLWLTSWLRGYFPAIHNWVVFNLVDGLIRVIIFLCYIVLISLMKDIRRVFQYHGAEHKVVHTWEAAEELTVENARRKSTLHPRCGTSFLMFVMVVSIIVFSIFKFDAFWAIFLSRLVLIPVVSGLSYELIRLSAPRCQKGFFRSIVLPGLALQRITTKEPSDDQLEIAIHALKEALDLEGIKAREAQTAA